MTKVEANRRSPLSRSGRPIALKPAKTQVGGGGGGGDRDVLQATQGRLPKFSMQQITPPAVVIRNENPKLPVEPTIVPPEMKLAMNNMPNLGDPKSGAVIPSNGTGSGGGIGSGSGGASVQEKDRGWSGRWAAERAAVFFALAAGVSAPGD